MKIIFYLFEKICSIIFVVNIKTKQYKKIKIRLYLLLHLDNLYVNKKIIWILLMFK